MPTSARVNHRCPVRDCQRTRKANQVLCRQHWYMVPSNLRTAVWNAFNNARGSEQHLAAIKAAIESVNELEAKSLGRRA